MTLCDNLGEVQGLFCLAVISSLVRIVTNLHLMGFLQCGSGPGECPPPGVCDYPGTACEEEQARYHK